MSLIVIPLCPFLLLYVKEFQSQCLMAVCWMFATTQSLQHLQDFLITVALSYLLLQYAANFLFFQ